MARIIRYSTLIWLAAKIDFSMLGKARSSLRPRDDRKIVPLLVQDLPTVAAREWGFLLGELAGMVSECPHLAWRVEGSAEYIIGGRWRRRREIGSVEDLHARANRGRLLDRLTERLHAEGSPLLLLGSTEQERNLGFYLAEGFQTIDEIVRYQKQGTEAPPPDPRLPIRPLAPADMGQLLAVDHAAFPWLWWNSAEEFSWYLGLPGVEACVVSDGDRIVGYAGFTISGRQGHLDRLAVLPSHQGRGFGRALVLFTLSRMANKRAERVALTTQVDNHKSARLYGTLGFVRTAVRFPIHGLWLNHRAEESPR